MATTQTIVGIDRLRGPSSHSASPLEVVQLSVRIAGSYDQAARPSFDILAALQAMKQGIGAVGVKTVSLLRDAVVAGVVQTAPNATIVLSGTGNKTITFRIATGGTAANGDIGSGAEVATSTVVDMVLTFVAVLTET